jgi:DNA repair protein RecO (recombination protein O)
MPSIKTRGINLRSIKVGEADKIIRVFTREYGKISFIAKGARKTSSKFGGRLEPFVCNDYFLGEGKSLYVLSQVETVESFRKIREDNDKLTLAAFFVRLTDASTMDHQKNPELYGLLLDSLRLLDKKIDFKVLKLFFQLNLMKVEGFFPHLDTCVKCKKKVTKEPSIVHYNAGLGGIICTPCSTAVVYGKKIDYHVVKLMRSISNSDPETLAGLSADTDDISRISDLITPPISDHIGKDMREW